MPRVESQRYLEHPPQHRPLRRLGRPLQLQPSHDFDHDRRHRQLVLHGPGRGRRRVDLVHQLGSVWDNHGVCMDYRVQRGLMRRLLAVLLLAVAPCSYAGMPTFIANGAATNAANGGNCTPNMPATINANDILILVACGEGDDDGIGIGLGTANGFASVMAEVVADDGDAAEEDPEINCETFWKRAVGGGGDSAPIVTDSGDHTTCQVHSFGGVKTSGNPWNITSSGNDSGANDQSANIPGATTTAADVLVVLIQGVSRNAADSSECGAVTNADLANITERFDDSRTQGLGGGHCIITGEKAAAGTYATSTLTIETSTFKAAFSIGLEGAVSAARRIFVIP